MRKEIFYLKMDINQIQTGKPDKKIVNAFTSEELEKMISHIDTDTASGKKLLCMIYLGALAGLRGKDVLGLKLSEIDWVERKIRIIQSKTDNYVEIPLTGRTLNSLADYILNYRKKPQNSEYNDYVFLTERAERRPITCIHAANKAIRKLMRQAGVELGNMRAFHSLRRYYATQLTSNNTDPHTVAQLLGHQSMDSNRHYITFDRKNTLLCAQSMTRVKINGGKYYAI